MSNCKYCNNISSRIFFGLDGDCLLNASLGINNNKIELRQNGNVLGYVEVNYCPFCGRKLGD